MKGQGRDCPRCHRLIVETYSDVASPNHAGQDMIGWRCVNCGEYVDQLVLLNRLAQERESHTPMTVLWLNALPLPAYPIKAHRRMEAA